MGMFDYVKYEMACPKCGKKPVQKSPIEDYEMTVR